MDEMANEGTPVKDRWCALTLAMDCYSREFPGWRLSQSGNAKAAEAALEVVLVHRYGVLGKAGDALTIRSDIGWVFTPKQFTHTMYHSGLKREFIQIASVPVDGYLGIRL